MNHWIFLFLLSFCSLPSFAQNHLEMPETQRQELDRLFQLREKAQSHFTEQREKLGAAGFKESINTGKQRLQDENGEVKLTLIDGEIIERIRPADSQKAFVFVDKNNVDQLSSHLLKVFIPRQHIDGGHTRTDGERGRDIVLVWMDGESVESVENHDRPTRGSLQWWKEYAQATYQKPKRQDVMFGLFSASLQVAFAAGVSAAKVALDPSSDFLMTPLVLNGIFGSVIGTFSQTYVNWVYRGGTAADSSTKVRVKQALKSSAVSVLYAYTLVMATSGGLDAVNFLNLSALQNHLHIWSNIFFNNLAKVEFAQWAKILERERKDIKEIEIQLPLTEKKWKTGIKQGKVNFQIYSYTPVNVLRTADLIGVSFSGIPLGKILLWFSIPITKYATLKWAEKYHPEQAKTMGLRKEWEDLKRLPSRLPRMVSEKYQSMSGSTRIGSCEKAVGGI